jgi:hypothetical protein
LTTYISGAILFDSELTNYSTTTTTGYSAGGLSFYTSDTGSGWSSSSAKRRMVIHGGGNVGIGTTSPEHNLQVIKASPGNNYTLSDAIASIVADVEPAYGKYGLYFGVNQSNGWSWIQTGRSGTSTNASTGDQFNLILQPNAGNVGIGTTEPMTNLDVTSSGSEGKIMIQNDTLALLQLRQPTLDKVWNLEIGRTDGEFSMRTAAGEKIRIKENGNVGIGTTDPQNILHVRGLDNHFRLTTSRSSGSHLNWSPSGGAGSDWDLRYSSNGSSTGDRLWFWWNGDQRFYTDGGTDRMIIKSGGNVGIGTVSPAYQFEVTSSGTSALFNASTAYVMGWNRSDITNGMWWWHVEGSYSTLHRNGYGHCARFYRTTNSSCCVFGDPGIANAYTEYHTNYSSWDGKLLVGAGPMGNDSGQNNWVANYACVFATTTNLHLESGAGATMYLNYYTDGNVWIDGSVRYTSDDRLKHNEKEVVNALDVINKLDVLTYFKSKKKYAENHHYELDQSGNPITDDSYYIETGLIAQRVKEIPELEYCVSYTDPIYEDDDYGDYAVNYRDIFCYNVVATQELDRKVIALESENAELKTEVATLKSELAAIKQHLGI